jgi:hypothetical protein
MVIDLIHAKCQKVGKHNFNDGFLTRHCQADAGPGNTSFANRRGNHTMLVFIGETYSHLECTTVRIVQILAQQNHTFIVLKQFVQGIVERQTNIGSRRICFGTIKLQGWLEGVLWGSDRNWPGVTPSQLFRLPPGRTRQADSIASTSSAEQRARRAFNGSLAVISSRSSTSRRSSPLLCGPILPVSITSIPGRRLSRMSSTTRST